MEKASLRRELDSVRREEESCRAQLNDLHKAYFSLQQCLGRRVHKLQVSGCLCKMLAGQCKMHVLVVSTDSSTWGDHQ